ncbi:hypothetical protein SynRS9909_01897 [Synechococcus sp. RS9909]|uniref:hypothetical protein n=1 Tax=unclassified Synechococcus TaxID=2626047 RepID=UPI000068F748|nr:MULTISPECIES: hypothetical protein [unclassified Synechococcus]EAQ69851.1 hypothetical protein RS9917_10456 [Synechococcus sp. RS9917]QNI79880.1 hypothetical protein SynRS9909_01897 [Synechococcus sp. RS9909]
MAETDAVDPAVVSALVEQVRERYGSSPQDPERMCWMVVHEHHHGAMPTEYDIREVDEALYLAVLARFR